MRNRLQVLASLCAVSASIMLSACAPMPPEATPATTPDTPEISASVDAALDSARGAWLRAEASGCGETWNGAAFLLGPHLVVGSPELARGKALKLIRWDGVSLGEYQVTSRSQASWGSGSMVLVSLEQPLPLSAAPTPGPAAKQGQSLWAMPFVPGKPPEPEKVTVLTTTPGRVYGTDVSLIILEHSEWMTPGIPLVDDAGHLVAVIDGIDGRGHALAVPPAVLGQTPPKTNPSC